MREREDADEGYATKPSKWLKTRKHMSVSEREKVDPGASPERTKDDAVKVELL